MDADDIAAGRARYRRRLAASTAPRNPRASEGNNGTDDRRTLSGLPLDPVYGPPRGR